MKKEWFVKTLALGIVVLFIGSGVTSAFYINFLDNNPPYVPSNPIPPDGATNIPLICCVGCTGGDPDGDLVVYNVYFENKTPPHKVLSNSSKALYCTPTMEFNTTYYWKVVSWDEHGASTEGPIWSFTTIGDFNSHTFYVGGSGPGNYTKIQDAIDIASVGDTVFVYNGTYYENVLVETSIRLVGEEKNTTIIDGIEQGFPDFCVFIEADNVTVTRFTIRNSKFGGIYVDSDYNIITDNIVLNNLQGIAIICELGGNIVTNNLILNNNESGGLIVISGRNNNISENIISQSGWYGICLEGVEYSNISNNVISGNENGIYAGITFHNIFYRNNISNNKKLGIEIFCTSFDRFIQNTFIGNKRNVYFIQPIILRIKFLRIIRHNSLQPNVWDGNYWDRQRTMPYLILGLTTLWDYLGRIFLMNDKYFVDSFQVDWHPAKEPYVI
jgi:parallel beta-helix repeat protein